MKQLKFLLVFLITAVLLCIVVKVSAQDTIVCNKQVTYIEEPCADCKCAKKYKRITIEEVIITCVKEVKQVIDTPDVYEFTSRGVLPATPEELLPDTNYVFSLPELAPAFVVPTIVLDTQPKIECPIVFNAEKWVDKYQDVCENAPTGNYQIIFLFSKNENKPVNLKFDYIKVPHDCGFRYMLSSIYKSYCKAEKDLVVVKQRYPDAYIKLIQ
mgnify:CR=1 FL=1